MGTELMPGPDTQEFLVTDPDTVGQAPDGVGTVMTEDEAYAGHPAAPDGGAVEEVSPPNDATAPEPAAPPEAVAVPKAEWDVERQKRDQEAATLRRENAALLERVTKLEATPTQDGAAGPEAAGVEPLDEFATDEEKAARDKQIAERLQAVEARGAAQDAELAAMKADREATERSAAGIAILNTCVGEIDATVGDGEGHRNELIAAVDKELAKRGYAEGEAAPVQEMQDVAAAAAAAIKVRELQAGKKPGKPAAPKPPKPAAPSGEPPPASKSGVLNRNGALMTVDDAYADLKREGVIK